MNVVLASASEIRSSLLSNAGVHHEAVPARVDEEALKAGLLAEGASHRDIADALAEAKARKVSGKVAGAIVIGCDQVLSHEGRLISKPETRDIARDRLHALSGTRHKLVTAAVAYRDGEPLWRHANDVSLTMRALSETYIDDYLARNWESVRHSVGGYKLEEEGLRLFRSIEGDYFSALGLPMIALLSWLCDSGNLAA